jgi:Mg2+ and Co2+ transporter CorA
MCQNGPIERPARPTVLGTPIEEVAVPEARPSAVLRYDPERLPELRQAFARALEALRPKLDELEWKGRLHEAWMHDPVSVHMRDLYNEKVMDHPNGGYWSLRAYEAELKRVHDTLLAAERAYQHNEEVNTTLIRDALSGGV